MHSPYVIYHKPEVLPFSRSFQMSTLYASVSNEICYQCVVMGRIKTEFYAHRLFASNIKLT